MTDDCYDYVIVGAGSAGCVLASRLTARAGVRVLMLEAGPEPRSIWLRIPAGLPQILGASPYNWPDMTQPQAGLNGRRVWNGHGRTLGGGSAVNGMVYNRGHPRDYDHWREAGNIGWGWNDVQPHFETIEAELATSIADFAFDSISAFIAAGEAHGLARDDGFATQAGDAVGRMRMTIHRGRRNSAYDAFIAPVRRRRNLRIVTGALVERIALDGNRATGVHYRKDGQQAFARARGEVILCAGALDSPRLLMLSGVGPARHLAEAGVPVSHDLPGVGANLQDHLTAALVAPTVQSASLNRSLIGMRRMSHGLRYLLSGRGAAAMGSSAAGAFLRSHPDVDYPDIQINFRPFSTRPGRRVAFEVEPEPQITATLALLRPQSRGRILLASQDPAARPLIDPAYLTHPADGAAMVGGMRSLAAMFRLPALSGLLQPGPLPGDVDQADAAVMRHIVATGASMGHPAGTCRMGTDAQAVVDAELRVHGLTGLRVADNSVMPSLTSGNTNAPAMMIGDKAASLIRAAA